MARYVYFVNYKGTIPQGGGYEGMVDMLCPAEISTMAEVKTLADVIGRNVGIRNVIVRNFQLLRTED